MAMQSTFLQDTSIVVGANTPRLWDKPLSVLIDEQASRHQHREAVVVSWQSQRMSYGQLAERSKLVAKNLLALGLQHGDAVGIIGGNRYEYLEVFLGAGRIGCASVVLNNTFSPAELCLSITRANVKVLFMASTIGKRSLEEHQIEVFQLSHLVSADLKKVFCFDTPSVAGVGSYQSFLETARKRPVDDAALEAVESRVVCSDNLNLQFTSGTTGLPKAACLTHSNIINDARFVGAAMRLTPEDVVCCPPPLFHCFGLVMGFLASFYHGSTIVFPSDNFSPKLTIQAVERERATALLGVPTMFIAGIEAMKELGYQMRTVRTGLAAGAMVSPALMRAIRDQMHIEGMLIAYGMTETSPVTFITSIDDTEENRHTTIGRVFPHTAAKIVNTRGETLAFGERGELCTAGFSLQKGYWKDEERTQQVMQQDENGIVWMHTGDEGYIDADGYGHITGRIKDIIIRGGENISPSEIEDRLLEHTHISESCVVGLEDSRYGEVVACFLKLDSGAPERPTDTSLREWVSQKLGRVKEPTHIFWIGDAGVGDDIVKTGSGKHQKHIMRDIGHKVIRAPLAKL